MPRKKAPELTFQHHIPDFLVRVHKYGVLEQTDIAETEHCIAEDQLWAFLNAIRVAALRKLTADYGAVRRADPDAPHGAPVRRLDEVKATKDLVLCYAPGCGGRTCALDRSRDMTYLLGRYNQEMRHGNPGAEVGQ